MLIKCKIVADNIRNFLSVIFKRIIIRRVIACESSARQMIHMKCQALSSLKIK